ncbi:19273_t:CDS:2, partial [Dentiscutata erythropus]
WMANMVHELTKAGKLKRPSYALVAEWYSIKTDGSEDNLLFDYNRVERLEKADQLGSEENEITALDEATELDEVTELDEDIEMDNTGTYEASEDEENEYYADENEYVNHLVESQEINILENNLENINLGEDNEED